MTVTAPTLWDTFQATRPACPVCGDTKPRKGPYCSRTCAGAANARHGRLPIAPLLRQMEIAAREADGWRNLSRRFADTFGTAAASVERALVRMRLHQQSVSIATADAYAIALGLHPMNIWGDDWLEVDA